MLFSVLAHFTLFSQCDDGWLKSAGNLVGRGMSLDVDEENNFYGIGVYESPTEFEGVELPNLNNKNNIYFYKRNPDGSLAWLRFIEGHFSQARPSVLVLGDQLIISSSFLNSATFGDQQFVSEIGKKAHLVLALDLNGNLNWHKQFNNLSIVGADLDVFTAGMCVVDENTFLLTGNIYEKIEDPDSDFELSSDAFSVLLMKISKSGDIMWAKCSSGNLFSRGWSVTTSDDGSIVVSGMTNGDLVFDDNIFFLNSATYSFSPFVAKFDSEGNNLWVTGGWCPNFGTNYTADSDAEGNVYVGGGFTNQTTFGVIQYTTSGINDGSIIKYDKDGELLWVKKIGAEQSVYAEYVTSIEVFDDYFLASGIVVEGAKFDSDNYLTIGPEPATRYFLAKYDLDGNLLELIGAGGNGFTEVYETKVKDDFVYVQGKYNGLGMFGNDTIAPIAGFQDSFSSAAFQWKFKLGDDLDPLQADFECENIGDGTYKFTSASTGNIDALSWSFGVSYYEQQFGEVIEQNLFEAGPTEVCLTISNCFTRQIKCKIVQVEAIVTPLVPVSYARLLADNNYSSINIGKSFELRGVVHGNNYSDSGLDFYLLDNSAGINIYRSFPVEGYQPTEGDSLHVTGEIEQYLGQIRLVVETLEIIAENQTVQEPISVLRMSESNEGRLVELRCCSLVNPEQWGNFENGFVVDVSSDIGEFSVKILANSTLIESDAPEGIFNIVGLVGQASFVTPTTDAYFLLPRYVEDFREVDEPDLDFEILVNNGAGQVICSVINQDLKQDEYTWNFSKDLIEDVVIADTTSTIVYNFEDSGAYEVCLSADDCLGTVISICKDFDVNVSAILVGDTTTVEPMDTMIAVPFLELTEVKVLPNPAFENIIIESAFEMQKVCILDALGREIYSDTNVYQESLNIDIRELKNGLYFVSIETENHQKVVKKLIVSDGEN